MTACNIVESNSPKVLESANGFFIGIDFAGTGIVRLSFEYWKTFERANKALIEGTWTARELGSSGWTHGD